MESQTLVQIAVKLKNTFTRLKLGTTDQGENPNVGTTSLVVKPVLLRRKPMDLDMHELYNDYINSKFGKQIDYSSYLEVFSQPHTILQKLKLTREKAKSWKFILRLLLIYTSYIGST
ncbi:hypothetical protein Ccrd_010304 [Cynara cardunculus var. scolymus]|uniref:SF3A3 domain-containing protein n=1 Tax=Cynara cardunculus var. scolymus TaxID=59895 RepID=A0A103YLG1_CYNCS|nr:hypothetical protein Ccrd_010304 [Cynara cardunculus var. scolymus]